MDRVTADLNSYYASINRMDIAWKRLSSRVCIDKKKCSMGFPCRECGKITDDQLSEMIYEPAED